MNKTLTLALAGAATMAVASPAMAAPQTVVVKSDSFTPKSVSINSGEAITWDVQEGGHNIDVYQGPETWKSTSGKDAKGTQVSHVFNSPGTYQYICDYHSSMKATVTVVQAPAPQPQPQPTPQPQPKPTPQPQPKPGGSGGSTGGGSSSGGGSTQGGTAAGPAGDTGSAGSAAGASGVAASVDPAAPALRASISRARTLTVNAGKSGRVIVTARNMATKKIAKRTYRVRAGRNTLSLKKFLSAKRYRLSVVLVDADGNRSAPVRLKLSR